MKGSIRQQGKHSWQLTVDIGYGSDGKRQRQFETVKGNKRDAQRRLNEIINQVEKGVSATPGRLTVAEHLNNWLEGYVASKCSHRTQEGYRSIIERRIIPALGNIQLKQLLPQAIQEYYSKCRGENLAERTINHHHRVLSEALKYAVRQGYLGRNPCDLVDAPSAKKKSMRTLTPSEVVTLLNVATGNYYYPIIYTALNTGLRQAELLGLRWRDIDLESDKPSISVSQVLYKRGGVCEFKEPKTSHSRRRVAIRKGKKSDEGLYSYLKEYRAERESLYLHLGSMLNDDSLVFASVKGEPIDPGVLSHTFNKLVRQAGLENVRFHDLRHSFASLMLMRGAKPKVISEALGHSSVAFTMDTYSHIIPGMQEDDMELLNDVIPPAINGNNNVVDLS